MCVCVCVCVCVFPGSIKGVQPVAGVKEWTIRLGRDRYRSVEGALMGATVTLCVYVCVCGFEL